ncbi:MAG: hypothetical protein ACI4F5_00265 [Acutalibacteraceae bacterium]
MNKQPCSEHQKIYEEFVRDIRHDERYPFIRNISDYKGESIIKLCPSQHQFVTPYQQKKITESFIDFLTKESFPIVEMQVCTIANQKVFDAICNQKNLKSLRIKCFKGKDISNITKLTKLKKLFIESGSGIEDISPLAEMMQLEVLILGETKKIYDYSCLSKLRNLKVLGVCRYQTSYNGTKLKMKSDLFIMGMPNLEWVDLTDCIIG